MRIAYCSDLHLEFHDYVLPELDCDVYVLAGDISGGNKSHRDVERLIANLEKPVVYVHGNHECYKNQVQRVRRKMAEIAQRYSHFHFLTHDNPVTIDDVMFVGDTLWTDFNLLGNPQIGMFDARQQMNDYRYIRFGDTYKRLHPNDVLGMHRAQLSDIWTTIQNANGGKVVGVSHHAPCELSILDEYVNDPLSAAYASRSIPPIREQLPQLKLWIHGHIHRAVDYMAGDIPIVSNPRGYPGEYTNWEPTLVREI